LGELLGCRFDGCGQISGKDSQFAVGLSGCSFDDAQRADEGARKAKPANGKVLDRALGLGAVKCFPGNQNFAHGIPLDSRWRLHLIPLSNSNGHI
jgi:hypothetical protein